MGSLKYKKNLSTVVVDIVNIKEQRKLTPSDSNNPLGKLMPSLESHIYVNITTRES